MQEKGPWYAQSEVVLGIGVIAILAMLIIPLPGFILDLLIVVSMAMGMIILLTSLSMKEPSDFSIFPNLLLITTLYRLALNVSTTRQILSQGSAFNSHIIDAFGTFVVGGGSGLGKYMVGFIIFLILIIVQILVITKGATRIAEVAARFTLDALPGKQMAIDTELSSGNINEEEARTRRKKVQKEVDFYGAMDGASKFVQGDVRAGLIITAINLIGGIIIGMAIRKESFGFAVETYGKLTIGDGLVSQIPGLLATTATGMIVTRAASEKELSQEFKSQIFSNPKTLYVVSACLALAAFIPGLPMFSLFFFSIGLAYLAYIIDRNAKETITSIEKKEAENKAEKKPDYYKELRTDPIEVELGLNLVPLVNASLGGVLLDQITNLRRRFATDTGLVIPAVRILDNLELDPDSYAIKIHGVIVGDSKIRPTKLMAIDNSGKRALDQIMGEEFLEPTFGFKAKWIDPADKVDAENKGAAVVDPSTVIVTHLKELISNHAASLLGREEVKNLLDHVKTSYPTLVSEIDEKKLGVGLIQQVLQNLLREGLGIKNLASILEAILNNEPKTRDPFFLSESVRQAISRQIVTDYLSKDGKLHVVTMDPKVSEKLSKSIVVDPIEGSLISVPPDYYHKLIESIAREYNRFHSEGRFPIIVTSRALRLPLSYMLAKEFPPRNFAVLAMEEIHAAVKTSMDGIITVQTADPVRARGSNYE
ncbi:MAG TPA: flagellar biosynthesis protein FlhA [Leptospiraceae bacterium]|nr:flagellar biosynthesis protein FlhA [Leptospiraceae bacterium]HNH07234.1 flagellar biosynthesis protein FlhA [Leptospiraceae bacterium]HNM02429.1 flagellar biosynthesis protein FlhA [Leptospiraceae bacterium]HNN02395.1 flagellar biosynthesis protein FlhA [Leptospiraceae bacterium]HNO22688.1 flagellar biosynthesis protein FlhA [Leptospiraceae bacterium]